MCTDQSSNKLYSTIQFPGSLNQPTNETIESIVVYVRAVQIHLFEPINIACKVFTRLQSIQLELRIRDPSTWTLFALLVRQNTHTRELSMSHIGPWSCRSLWRLMTDMSLLISKRPSFYFETCLYTDLEVISSIVDITLIHRCKHLSKTWELYFDTGTKNLGLNDMDNTLKAH
ncbi:hypothetical protein BC939DRAFT_472806 [Gamsiella multidivaricata]|uniref:uncharacterized protein n=1 Tax=Gamsiella multidivaricata TaxID=101098 RepID=UPI00221F84AD|nr:uncharacterized protein BC939DRAFT_472806 [Gamsiella multidivaricata]KAI7831694.1 hypothetical protein BC939DRAFT_472806 [Gamsiella multidivaricata]